MIKPTPHRGAPRRFTDQQIRDAHAASNSLREMCRILDTTPPTLYAYLNRLDLSSPRTSERRGPPRAISDEDFKSHHAKAKTVRDLAFRTGLAPMTVRNYLTRLGLPAPTGRIQENMAYNLQIFRALEERYTVEEVADQERISAKKVRQCIRRAIDQYWPAPNQPATHLSRQYARPRDLVEVRIVNLLIEHPEYSSKVSDTAIRLNLYPQEVQAYITRLQSKWAAEVTADVPPDVKARYSQPTEPKKTVADLDNGTQALVKQLYDQAKEKARRENARPR